jgi:hypothetical protein
MAGTGLYRSKSGNTLITNTQLTTIIVAISTSAEAGIFQRSASHAAARPPPSAHAPIAVAP